MNAGEQHALRTTRVARPSRDQEISWSTQASKEFLRIRYEDHGCLPGGRFCGCFLASSCILASEPLELVMIRRPYPKGPFYTQSE